MLFFSKVQFHDIHFQNLRIQVLLFYIPDYLLFKFNYIIQEGYSFNESPDKVSDKRGNAIHHLDKWDVLFGRTAFIKYFTKKEKTGKKKNIKEEKGNQLLKQGIKVWDYSFLFIKVFNRLDRLVTCFLWLWWIFLCGELWIFVRYCAASLKLIFQML